MGVTDSDPGVRYSSPRRNAADGWRKGQVKRQATIALKKKKKREDAEKARVARKSAIIEALEGLKGKDIGFGEVTDVVFDKENTDGYWRTTFFAKKEHVRRVLDYGVSSQNTRSGQGWVIQWMMSWLVWKVGKEGNAITKSGVLRTTSREINGSFICGLSFRSLAQMVREYCPITVRIFTEIATTRRQRKEASELSIQQKEIVSIVICIFCTMSSRIRVCRSSLRRS